MPQDKDDHRTFIEAMTSASQPPDNMGFVGFYIWHPAIVQECCEANKYQCETWKAEDEGYESHPK